MCWDCAWTLLMPLAWHFTLQGQCARCWNSFACCSTMSKKYRVKYLCQDCSWTAKMCWDCAWTLLMQLTWHFTLQGQCARCWNSFAWCLTNVLGDVQLCWKSIESNICVKIALLHLGFHLGIRNRRHVLLDHRISKPVCAVGYLSLQVYYFVFWSPARMRLGKIRLGHCRRMFPRYAWATRSPLRLSR
jgi:hypothetical protein